MKQLLQNLKESSAWNDPVAERLYFVMVMLAFGKEDITVEHEGGSMPLQMAPGELLWDEATLSMAAELDGSELKYGASKLREAGLIETVKIASVKGKAFWAVRILNYPTEAKAIKKPKPKHTYPLEFEGLWKVSGTGSKWNAFLKWEKLGMNICQGLMDKWQQYELYQTSMDRSPKHLEFWISGKCYEQEWTHKAQKTKAKVYVEKKPEPIDDKKIDSRLMTVCKRHLKRLAEEAEDPKYREGTLRAGEFLAHGNIPETDALVLEELLEKGLPTKSFTTAETEELMKYWMSVKPME